MCNSNVRFCETKVNGDSDSAGSLVTRLWSIYPLVFSSKLKYAPILNWTYTHTYTYTNKHEYKRFFQFFSCPPTLVVSFSHLASLHCSPYFFRTFLSLVFFVRIFLNVDVSICIFYKEMNGAKRKRGQKRRRNNNQFELDHLDQLDYYEKKKKRNTNMDFYEKENFIKYTPKKNRPDIANTCTYT